MKKQILFLTYIVFALQMLTTLHAEEFEKLWEVDINKIFDSRTLSINFSPVLVEDNVVFGNKRGEVKIIDSKQRKIKKIIKIPISIDRSLQFQSKELDNYVVFYGQSQIDRKYYYCSIDIKKRKVKGVVDHSREFLPFGNFAIFEKNKNFIIFNPKEGKGVYRQTADYRLEKSIFTQDYNRYLFQSEKNEIIQVSIPKFGGSLIMSRSGKKDVITFEEIVKISPDMIADNIKSNTLYYHRTNGMIGQLNVKDNTKVWEKKYFKAGMGIQGPYVQGEKLIYLVSYPFKKEQKERLGKLICLDRESGKAIWISADLPFNNFGIVQFDRYILSSDQQGNLLFLDIEDGKVHEKLFVGAGLSKPIVSEKELIAVTNKKIYKFRSNRLGLKLKLMWDKIWDYIT